MYLVTKFNNINFLICSISTTVATGVAMSFLIAEAGTSPLFTVVYLISEVVDNATVLILLTLLNNAMQLESRGIINGIHLLSVQFSGMVLNLVNGYIQGSFPRRLPSGKTVNDYVKGGRHVLELNYGLMLLYLVILVGYRVR